MTYLPPHLRLPRVTLGGGRCRCGGVMGWAGFARNLRDSLYSCDRCGRRARLLHPPVSPRYL